MIERIDLAGNVSFLINGILIILVIAAIILPFFFFYRKYANKKKYPFKINMSIRRNNGWVTNTKLKGGIVKDEKGVSLFRIPYGFRKYYEKRDLPSSSVVLSDGTIYMARIGETLLYLNPKIDMEIEQLEDGSEEVTLKSNEQNKRISFKPITPQTKYDAIKDINDAFRMVESGSFDWKPILAYGGLLLLFVGVIITTYIIYERIDIGTIKELTTTNAEIARTNLEIVDKLRTIQFPIGG